MLIDSIDGLFHAGMMGAMSAAVHLAIGLDAMADDSAVAMRAARGQLVNGTFEAVERM